MAQRAVGLDTSIVLRLLVGKPDDQAERARALLDELFEERVEALVSDLVLAETYYALQHHYQVPKAEALQALRRLVEESEIRATGVASRVLQTPHLASARPGFVDRLIHEQYAVLGAPTVTFERASGKLSGTKVL